MIHRLVPGLALAALLATSAAPAADPAQVTRTVPYATEQEIPEAVRKECSLPTDLSAAIAEFAGGSVSLVDGAPSGRALKLKITHVLSKGGPFAPKSVAVEGELVEGGAVTGSFRARRNTGGPTCAALTRIARALGKDIAQWLVAPTTGATLGDAR